ncbi:MAG: AP-1 complex subunit beta-1 [Amphiamblys sp. WSBS2006]|nr:MAG: AP-1 complex subunit beta-1 [Amphiamblys sp. WSBS2006]
MAEALKGLAEIAANVALSFSKQEYFSQKTHENDELAKSLHKDGVSQKEAIKKIIVKMTHGEDVSELFGSVLQCMQTRDLEQKRLVYLYLVYNSVQNEATAILSINTLCKDIDSGNLFLRGLAIRTIGSICVPGVFENTVDQIQRGLSDDSPYVRKAAVLSAGKMYAVSPELCSEAGMVSHAASLIEDPSPLVSINALRTFCEMHAGRAPSKTHMEMLVSSLDRHSEWGQIEILDLASLHGECFSEKEALCRKVAPHLKRENPAVVLSASKLLAALSTSDEVLSSVWRGLQCGLHSPYAEIQFAFLRSVPSLLEKGVPKDICSFFCKYNDALFIKKEKLGVISEFAGESELCAVVEELAGYTQEVDMVFVRMALDCLLRLGARMPACMDSVVAVVLPLLQSENTVLVESAVCVLERMQRQSPSSFQAVERSAEWRGVLADERAIYAEMASDDAKRSFLWLLGECSTEKKEDAFSFFSRMFENESTAVQAQILVAGMKMFARSETGYGEVAAVIEKSLASDSVDLHDTGLVYRRLLGKEPLLRRMFFQPKVYPSPARRQHPPVSEAGLVSSVLPRDTQKPHAKHIYKKSNTTLNDLIEIQIESTEETEGKEDDIFSILCK